MASAVQHETVGCNLCGSAEYSRLHVKHGYTIVRCNRCRLVFLNPRPVPSELANIYDDGKLLRRDRRVRERRGGLRRLPSIARPPPLRRQGVAADP